MKIKRIQALQIFDSRGLPTVECAVTLEDGTTGTGIVPSGASTGRYEALELRDRDPNRFRGHSVTNAVRHIETIIAPEIVGEAVYLQQDIDRLLCELDGTPNKSRLGANSILAVSMAVATAAAASENIPLFESLGENHGTLLPLPQVQLFGGGAHSKGRTDIQDFLIIPVGANSYSECLEMIHNVYQATGEWMLSQNKNYGVADEGGYWPAFDCHADILNAMVTCIELAGYTPGSDISIALDIAAGEFCEDQLYHLDLDKRVLNSGQLSDLLQDWCAHYPIISIEDPFSDQDEQAWCDFQSTMGQRIQIIGDDLFTTSVPRIEHGIKSSQANAVLIKPNQIGTVTETVAAIRCTQNAGWLPVISARSGETEDVFITHLAVATNAGQIKVGSFSRGERMAKWNELLRLERCLSNRARFIGSDIFKGSR